MSSSVTLESVTAMVAQLPPRDQVKLVAQIGERLSSEKEAAPGETPEERQDRLAKVEALFAEIDALAESIEGKFDSVKDIREIREERVSRL